LAHGDPLGEGLAGASLIRAQFVYEADDSGAFRRIVLPVGMEAAGGVGSYRTLQFANFLLERSFIDDPLCDKRAEVVGTRSPCSYLSSI
jgi:hypothetical protein